MRRRPSALWLGAFLAATAASSLKRQAIADQIPPGSATYSLTNESKVPVGVVDLEIQPPGSVVPPLTTDPNTGRETAGNPLRVVNESSSGFAQVDDSLGTIAGKRQVLELTFGLQPVIDPKTGRPEIGPDNRPALRAVLGPDGKPVGGLQPNGKLTFSLALGATSPPPQLLPTPSSADLVKLQLLTPPPSTTPSSDATAPATSSSPTSQPLVSIASAPPAINVVTPEPISLAIWAVPAAFGWLRVRARRRNG